ncbi:MAG: hypothetical protein K0Q81_640 [Paenibacillus sp.]|nr:hypothetical protein [Paenibacillus sp.]
MSTDILIELEKVKKSYRKQQVLHDVNYQVNQGDIIGLLGPNGAGKTTLVRLMNGVIRPDEGNIRIAGLSPDRDGEAIRRMSGIVTEGAGLYRELSGRANLEFFAKIYNCSDLSIIDELLSRFELKEHEHKAAGHYSTGMKKRLALAKALLHRPSLLFLDEPTNGLDPDGIRMVLGYLKEINREQGTTIILCSHVLHQLEDICDSFIFLEQGRVIEQGSKLDLEHKYLKAIELRVETGLQVQGERFGSYKVQRAGQDILQFKLSSKEEISGLLQQILSVSWINSVEIMNRDLESLYFHVRRNAE